MIYKTLQQKRAVVSLVMQWHPSLVPLHYSKVESKIILSDDVPEDISWLQCIQAGFAFVKLAQGREFLYDKQQTST